MKGILIQFLATFIISLGNFYFGFFTSWSSYTLEMFRSEESPLDSKITKNQETLIGFLTMLGCVLGTLLGGYLAEVIGRKNTEVLCGLCSVLATIIIATTKNIIPIITGRYISGLGIGVHIIIGIVYISEYSETAVRGTLISMTIFGYVFGSLVFYVMGWLCSYDTINYFILTLCVVHAFLVLYLKESPIYLIRRGKFKEALNSLLFYRGASDPTKAILEEMNCLHQQSISDKIITVGSSKFFQRPMATITGHIILSVLMGSVAVQAYARQLFSAAAPNWSPHICSVFLAIAMVVGSGISMTISDLIGRRVLYISSSIVTSATLVLLASLLRWSWAPDWTIPLVILLNNCSFLCGAGVPYVQLGETFPSKLKSTTTTIALCCMCLSNFIVLALYGPLIDTIGLDGTFLVFGIIAAIASVTSFFFMKETKGVSLEKIQEMYDG